jgi:hypothetical protein
LERLVGRRFPHSFHGGGVNARRVTLLAGQDSGLAIDGDRGLAARRDLRDVNRQAPRLDPIPDDAAGNPEQERSGDEAAWT